MEKLRPKETGPFISRRMLIKIGTTTITGGGNLPDMGFMYDIARQTAELLRDGVQVAIVCSGAVASGHKDGTSQRIIDQQIDAVFGQPRLMERWVRVFATQGIEDVGQVLLTDENINQKKVNSRKVLMGAMKRGVVVVNCNDAVTDKEMRKVQRAADNDKLAGDVGRLIDADTVLILTDTDGVMDQSDLVPFVDRLEDIEDLIHGGGKGTGGPRSKWIEAKSLAKDGRWSIIANGRAEDVILKVARRENVGTRFIQGYSLY